MSLTPLAVNLSLNNLVEIGIEVGCSNRIETHQIFNQHPTNSYVNFLISHLEERIQRPSKVKTDHVAHQLQSNLG